MGSEVPGHEAARWRVRVGPWWPQPRDSGARSREPGYVPGGALWRHAQTGSAGSSPVQGAGPQLASFYSSDWELPQPGIDESARMSESGC